jgi:hypothetical protein
MWKRKRELEGNGKGNAPKSRESDNNPDPSQRRRRGELWMQACWWGWRKHSSLAWTKFYRYRYQHCGRGRKARGPEYSDECESSVAEE